MSLISAGSISLDSTFKWHFPSVASVKDTGHWNFVSFYLNLVVLSRQLRRRRRGRDDSGWQNRKPEHRCSGSLGLHSKINNKYNAKQMSLKIDLFFYIFFKCADWADFLTAEAACWAVATIYDLETEGKAAYLLKMTFAYYSFAILLIIYFMVTMQWTFL